MASGIKANFGTMTKPFHVGHTTRNGLLAALLAKEGMTANAGALEHPQGFFAVYNGAGTFKPERLLEHWGDPFDLVEPGIAFKRHPCCGSTHPAVDAMLHLRETHGLSPERVAKVESWTHPRRLQHTNRPNPQSGLDGKFSIQYVLARALMHGIVSMEHFSDDAVRDPATRALMTRVHVRARSRGQERDQRSFLLPPARSRPRPARRSSTSSTVRSAATATIRCRPARWKRNSAIARRPCSTPRPSKRSSPGAMRSRRCRTWPTSLNVIATGVKPPAVATRSRAYA